MEVQQNDQRQSYTIRYAQHPMYCLWHVTTGRLGFSVDFHCIPVEKSFSKEPEVLLYDCKPEVMTPYLH